MTLLGLQESAEAAIKLFNTFGDGEPDLVPTGLRVVDAAIGGLFPGSAGILGAATGAGKSSLVLASALATKSQVGILSLEDTPDVLGSRSLAWASDVNSLKLRTKKFDKGDFEKLQSGLDRLKTTNVKVAYNIGGSIEEVCDSITALADTGCRLIWVDYIQKIRGIWEDRRNEVSTAFTKMQSAADKAGAALMVVSQFSRQDPVQIPRTSWLKESGDLENEARLIVLAWKDLQDQRVVNAHVAKSTFGGEGLRMQWRRDGSGTLREVVDYGFDAF